jgi:nicotinamide riboside transporter PnuC
VYTVNPIISIKYVFVFFSQILTVKKYIESIRVIFPIFFNNSLHASLILKFVIFLITFFLYFKNILAISLVSPQNYTETHN